MSVRFDAAADRLLRTANYLDYNAAYTFMCLVYVGTDPGAANYSAIFAINRNVDTADYDYLSIVNNSGLRFNISANIGGSVYRGDAFSAISVGNWYHVAMVRVAINSLALYAAALGGSLTATLATVTQSMTSRTASSRHEIGGNTSTNARPLSLSAARVAGVKIWSTNLTAAELTREMLTLRPQKFDNLHSWYPLLTGYDNTVDLSGNGYAWTTAGTLTDEDGPPISWGAQSPSILDTVAGVTAGALAQTLAALTVSSAGTVEVQGTADTTLDALVSSAAGTVAVQGASAVMLAALTISGAGGVEAKGASAQTLAALTGAAEGTVADGPIGALAVTLASLTGAAEGQVPAQGALNVALAALALSGEAGAIVEGAASLILGSLAIVATGGVEMRGSAAVLLSELTLVSIGTFTTDPPSTTGTVRGMRSTAVLITPRQAGVTIGGGGVGEIGGE
jgi:hypothetical protein